MFQFRKMISCATGRSFWAYLPYGCYCGLGGSGIPMDDTDRYRAASGRAGDRGLAVEVRVSNREVCPFQ